MTVLTRRALLGAAAAGAALGPLASAPAGAAAPPTDKQAPSFYRYKVGSHEITVVADGANTFPLNDNFVLNARKDDVAAALDAAYMPNDKVTIVFNPIVVNNGSKLVLIDTGNGPGAFAGTKGAVGQLPANLTAAGIDAKAIDIVIISHFHGDHVNGLVDADGGPAFPNAEVMVPARELAFWMDDGEMSRAPKGRMQDLFKNNRRIFEPIKDKVTRYDWDKEIVPGITAVATVGHTPGHTSYVVASGTSQVFIQSDVTNHPALFVRHPDWHAFFDQDPVLAETTRRKTYDMLVAEKMLIQGFHYPFPSLGHVERDGTAYREIPVAWSPVL
jgi:glyoxylase-like metal-dependent hydrolase (beta-lactamase superfamily II)